MTPLFEATGLRPAPATLPGTPAPPVPAAGRCDAPDRSRRRPGCPGPGCWWAVAAAGPSARSRSACHSGSRPQPRPARIMACLVSWPLTRQVCGDSTAKSRPWLNGEASVCTICTWSASSAGSSICPATTRPASAWPAPTTATICTEDSACTAMRGSRKCSPAMMPRAWLRSSRAAIGPPSGSTVTRGATDGRPRACGTAAPVGDGKQRIDDQRQFEFNAFAQPLRARPHGVDPQQDIAGIGQQRLALGRHDGTPALAVEQRHAQFGFHVGDGMADGRLHPRQLAGGGAEAAASATAANTRNWSRVRASSIGVSDLWNRSVALKIIT